MSRSMASSWWLSLAALASPLSVAAQLPLAQPEFVEEIRSYGEAKRDLYSLLVPFFATAGFSDATTSRSFRYEEDSIVFGGPDGDFLGIKGQYNCVVVTYYSTVREEPLRRAPLTKALAAFGNSLEAFLKGLPSPRPVSRRTVWGQPTCRNST